MARGKSETKKVSDPKAKYAEMKVAELKEELEKRGLVATGLKKALLDRLAKDDTSKAKKAPVKAKPVAKVVAKVPAKVPAKTMKLTAPAKAKPATKPVVKKTVPVKKVLPVPKKVPKKVVKAKPPKDEETASEVVDASDADVADESEVVEKSETTVEEKGKDFEDVIFPNKNYCINAEALAKIIHQVFPSGKSTKVVAKFEKFFSEMEGYVDSIEISTDVIPEKTLRVEVEKEELAKVITEERLSEKEEKHQEKPLEKPKEEKVPEFDDTREPRYEKKIGVFTTPDGYVWDPITRSTYARFVGGTIMPLTKEDLKLYKAKFWHIHVKGRGATEFATPEEIELLTEEAEKFNDTNVAKHTKKFEEDQELFRKRAAEQAEAPPVRIESDESTDEDLAAYFKGMDISFLGYLAKESGDDGVMEVTKSSHTVTTGPGGTKITYAPTTVEEVDFPSRSTKGEFSETKAREKVQRSSPMKVEKEEKEVLKPKITIDEDTFYKYVRAQHSTANQDDYIAISEKAGLSKQVGEQIVSQYYALHDRFPKAATEAKIASRTTQPQRITRPQTLSTRAAAPVPSRRLLQ